MYQRYSLAVLVGVPEKPNWRTILLNHPRHRSWQFGHHWIHMDCSSIGTWLTWLDRNKFIPKAESFMGQANGLADSDCLFPNDEEGQSAARLEPCPAGLSSFRQMTLWLLSTSLLVLLTLTRVWFLGLQCNGMPDHHKFLGVLHLGVSLLIFRIKSLLE